MCTLNNHQLWSRNIYDHELMILSMVLIDQNESNQNIFFIFGCTKEGEVFFVLQNDKHHK